MITNSYDMDAIVRVTKDKRLKSLAAWIDAMYAIIGRQYHMRDWDMYVRELIINSYAAARDEGQFTKGFEHVGVQGPLGEIFGPPAQILSLNTKPPIHGVGDNVTIAAFRAAMYLLCREDVYASAVAIHSDDVGLIELAFLAYDLSYERVNNVMIDTALADISPARYRLALLIIADIRQEVEEKIDEYGKFSTKEAEAFAAQFAASVNTVTGAEIVASLSTAMRVGAMWHLEKTPRDYRKGLK